MSLDDSFSEHVSALPGSTLAHVSGMPVCERLAQSLEMQTRDVWAIADERWPLTLAALDASQRHRVVEGESLLPHLLHAAGLTPDQVLFLLISPHVRRERYSQRDWAVDLVAECADPAAAFEAWMRRDDLTEWRIAAEATKFGFRTFSVDDPAQLEAATAFALAALQT